MPLGTPRCQRDRGYRVEAPLTELPSPASQFRPQVAAKGAEPVVLVGPVGVGKLELSRMLVELFFGAKEAWCAWTWGSTPGRMRCCG